MTNTQLLEELLELGYIKTSRLENAMQNILREDFVADELKKSAYENIPLSIGFGQTTSQPLVLAFMLELLGVNAGDTVLEIGSGSGWQSVLLSRLSDPGLVTSVERIPELYERAKKNAERYPQYSRNISFVHGNGVRGYEKNAPYNRIIAGASCEEIPRAWKEQVKIGGRVVFPEGEQIVLLEKTEKDEFIRKEFYGFSFVPLISEA